MTRVTTLNIVSGTATYALPADFRKFIRLTAWFSQDSNVIVSGAGLIPMPQGWKERHTINGLTITFIPTPGYTLARQMEYTAGYVLDVASIYQDMTDDIAAMVMLKAAAIALTLQANAATKESWSYTIASESVSKTQLANSFRDQAKLLDAQYLDAVKTYIGTVGLRGEVTDQSLAQ